MGTCSFAVAALLLTLAEAGTAAQPSSPLPLVLTAKDIGAVAQPADAFSVMPGESLDPRLQGQEVAVSSAEEAFIPLQVPALGRYRVVVAGVDQGESWGRAEASVDGEPVCWETVGVTAALASHLEVVLAEGTERLRLRRVSGRRRGVVQITVTPVMTTAPRSAVMAVGPFISAAPVAAVAREMIDAQAWKHPYPPETAPESEVPLDLGNGKSATWQPLAEFPVPLTRDRLVFTYLRTYLYAPHARKVALSTLGTAGVKLWVGGRLVVNNPAGRDFTADTALVDVKAGWNLVLMKVTGNPHGQGFMVTDPGEVRFARTPFLGAMQIAADDARRNYAQAFLSNGLVRLSLYLPDSGYYRGPRFDWSGLIRRCEYQGHSFFEDWQYPHDPHVNDAAIGTAEEFVMGAWGHPAPPGYEEAQPGETFLRIGVGVLLRSSSQPHRFSAPYKIVDSPRWEVRQGADWIEMRQICHGPRGWAYDYTKRITLPPGKPQFVIWHRLKNLGTKTIEQTVYCHNFLNLDRQPVGPEYRICFAYPPEVQNNPQGLAVVEGNSLHLARELQASEAFHSVLAGFEPNVASHDLTVENAQTGASVRITGDQSVVAMPLFATRRALCPEPFVAVKAEPGEAVEWSSTYTLGGE
ncbi:MAG: hypothetical protein GX100_02465 [candidate division WS1 bacterium]|nr:hypothetical protein [candidate division WS1 bacterium]